MERSIIAPSTVYADPNPYGARPARPLDRYGRLWTTERTGGSRRLIVAPPGARQRKSTGRRYGSIGYLVVTTGPWPDVKAAYGDENAAADAIESLNLPDLPDIDDDRAAEFDVAALENSLRETHPALRLTIAYTPAWTQLWTEHSGIRTLKERQRKEAQEKAEREEATAAARWEPVRDRLAQLGVDHTTRALADTPANRLTVRYTRKDAVTHVTIPVSELARLLMFIPAVDELERRAAGTPDQSADGEHPAVIVTDGKTSETFTPYKADSLMDRAHLAIFGRLPFLDEGAAAVRNDPAVRDLADRIAATGRTEAVRVDPAGETAREGQARSAEELEQRAEKKPGEVVADALNTLDTGLRTILGEMHGLADDLRLMTGETGSGKTSAAALLLHAAMTTANAHLENCDTCHPKMRLPEMCTEGQRLAMAAIGHIDIADALGVADSDDPLLAALSALEPAKHAIAIDGYTADGTDIFAPGCGAMDADDLDACGHCPNCNPAATPTQEQLLGSGRRTTGHGFVYGDTVYEIFENTTGTLAGTFGVRDTSAPDQAVVDGCPTREQAKARALADFRSFDQAMTRRPDA